MNYNNQQNNYYNPYQNQQYAPQQPVNMSELSRDSYSQIRRIRNGSAWTVELSKEDILLSSCPHRENNEFKFVDNMDGSKTCTICGAHFNLIDVPVEEIAAKVEDMVDILESIKVFYIDAPVSVYEKFMPIIPTLRNVPKLYDLAVSHFNRADNGGLHTQQGVGSFAMLNGIMGGGMNPMMFQQPMMQGNPMGYPQQQQYNYQQPQQYQGQNPFGSAQPQPMYGGQGMMQQQPVGNPMNYPQQGQAQQGQQPAPQAQQATSEPALESTKVFLG